MLKVIKESWYSKGLSFKCTECGKCCTGAPGYVWVTEEEIQHIAAYLNISSQEFHQKYVRWVDGSLSLREDPNTYDCLFLKDNKCQIYPHRPTQCRTFPWWPTNLRTEEDWKEAAKYCEGINSEAPVISAEIINSELAKFKPKKIS